ncbi:23 kDa integral membrane protein-like [Panulirus ornatus]|uniref:23 kDa integral membrane protein-like n=1 Tax=Panulirus ornatus TaxID=150431 RepID=UPI003A8A0364
MGCISKLGLFILNFLVFVVGVAVVVLASMIINKDNTYSVLLSHGTFSVPIIILIAGLFIVLLGFLGCCGAMKESSCMLNTYAFIVTILLIAEIVLAIILLAFTDQAESTIKGGMEDVFEQYGNNDTVLKKTIDAAQHDLHCCGVEQYTDWQNYTYSGGEDVSIGCCREQIPDCYKGMATLPLAEANKTIYTRGCYYALKDEIMGETIALGVTCLVLAVIQIMSICCACGIAKKSSQYV